LARRPEVGAACHANQALMAHKQKIVVQMAPKAASGGFHEGCLSWKYQGPSSVSVLPMPAIPKLMAKHSARLRQCRRSCGLADGEGKASERSFIVKKASLKQKKPQN
jgi:hypothetical protein